MNGVAVPWLRDAVLFPGPRIDPQDEPRPLSRPNPVRSVQR
jgi:hypothetical protein